MKLFKKQKAMTKTELELQRVRDFAVAVVTYSEKHISVVAEVEGIMAHQSAIISGIEEGSVGAEEAIRHIDQLMSAGMKAIRLEKERDEIFKKYEEVREEDE